MLQRFIEQFARPGLVVGVVVAMAAFYGADQFLARLERRETGADARALARQGETLLRENRKKEAIDAIDRAHLIERDNRYYTLELARALLLDGQAEKAVTLLQDVLDDDSNDGQANLLMARAMTGQSHFGSAESYYHRAIYGSWPAGQSNRSVQTRVELVSWLTAHGDRQSLLAELIPLEQRAKSDSAIAHRIPALYLEAGSVSQAEEAYRALIHADPADADAYAGLGQVQMKRGSFHAADESFLEALAHNPQHGEWKERESLARQAHDLDPTIRRLTSAETFARSNRILELARNLVQACHPDPSSLPSLLPSLLQTAQEFLTQKALRAVTNEAALARLDLAERLWRARPLTCAANPQQAELLNVLLRKIDQ